MCCIQREKRKAKEKERTECTKTRKNKINIWRKKNLEKDEGEEDFYKVKREREKKTEMQRIKRFFHQIIRERSHPSIHKNTFVTYFRVWYFHWSYFQSNFLKSHSDKHEILKHFDKSFFL
jgi:hypothetical protein